MAEAKSGDNVRVHYTGKLGDGTVFDSSSGGDPLEFTIGGGAVIPGFESAVVGMAEGETKTETISASDAYGDRDERLIVSVPRENVPDHLPLEIGLGLELEQPDGRRVRVTISELSEAEVTLDANHPLAGKDLTFDLTLVAILG